MSGRSPHRSHLRRNSRTQIVMLGTGTPRPDPARSGPATALVVNGTPYLVDFGPGVVRRMAAAYGKGIAAFGFRFETPDRVIVVSGDTAPTPSLAEHCEGCDVLIHEAYSERTYERVSPKWQRYRRTHHTSSRQLAALVTRVRPGLLVLYH